MIAAPVGGRGGGGRCRAALGLRPVRLPRVQRLHVGADPRHHVQAVLVEALRRHPVHVARCHPAPRLNHDPPGPGPAIRGRCAGDMRIDEAGGQRVRAQRKPRPASRTWGSSQSRSAARARSPPPLVQLPPRDTRLVPAAAPCGSTCGACAASGYGPYQSAVHSQTLPARFERAGGARAVGVAAHRRGGRPAVVAVVQRAPRDALAAGHRRALAAARVEAPRVRRLVAPGIDPAIVAARRVLPLGLGRQPPPPPRAVRRRLRPVDAVDRVVGAVAAVAPPAEPPHLRGRVRRPVHGQRRRAARPGRHAGGVAGHRHLGAIDAVRRQRDRVPRVLVGIPRAVRAPHLEHPGRHGDHVVRTPPRCSRGAGAPRPVRRRRAPQRGERGDGGERARPAPPPPGTPAIAAVRRHRLAGGRLAGDQRLQRVAHRRARREPLVGLAAQAAIDDRREPRIDPRCRGRERRRPGVQHRAPHVLLRVAVVRRLAGGELVEQRAERVDVRARRRRLAAPRLGRHVRRRAHHGAGAREPGRHEAAAGHGRGPAGRGVEHLDRRRAPGIRAARGGGGLGGGR